MIRLRFQPPRLFLFGVIALGLAGIACTVAADPKSPFLGEWRLITGSGPARAILTLLPTGSCTLKAEELEYRSCSWITRPNNEVTVNYGRYLSLSSANATVAGDELTVTFGDDREVRRFFTRSGSQRERDFIAYFEGAELIHSGDFEHGIAQWTLAADHGHAGAQNNLAWLYATGKRSEFRDGKKAVAYAEKATTNLKYHVYLDTLAAALARDDQFERAAKTQEEALLLLEKDESRPDRKTLLAQYRNRLALYKAGKAFTEP